MKERKLSDLDLLPDETVKKLEEEGIVTVEDFIYADPKYLSEVAGMSERDVEDIQEELRNIDVEFETLEKLERERRRITTGSSALDEILGGGVPCGELTEFAGPFGSGKSQIVFQLCVNVQLPEEEGGLESKAIFIDTEGTVSPGRIKGMAEALGLDPGEALRNVFVTQVRSVEEQMRAAEEAHKLCEREDIGLVVVDSLTAHFRAEYSKLGDVSERQARLMKHVDQLRNLAMDHDVAVVFTNQVHVDIEAATKGKGRRYEPVGGTIVAHQATHRIMLRRAKGEVRIARIIDSPYLPQREAPFRITEEGIRDVELPER
ncbi:DNA repair and recombination protein RadA [Methanopyrus kandleri]